MLGRPTKYQHGPYKVNVFPNGAMRRACQAAAICVTRPGAADSIPTKEQLDFS